jgi:hypothetical protein
VHVVDFDFGPAPPVRAAASRSHYIDCSLGSGFFRSNYQLYFLINLLVKQFNQRIFTVSNAVSIPARLVSDNPLETGCLAQDA